MSDINNEINNETNIEINNETTNEEKKENQNSPVVKKKMTQQEWKQIALKRNQMAILNKKTPFIIREAYKTARTNIIFSVSGSESKECKTIIITSSTSGEGKTTSTINLAITFALTGARVLLIDGDMRKPRAHQYLGLIKDNGLSTVLSKQKTFEEVVYRDERDGLDVLTSGSIPPNPAELLGSEAMQHLLEKLKLQYDYIFVDTPPVSIVTDAATISKFSSGVVLVVREGITNHESVSHSINLLKLANVKLLGFFVNDIDITNSGYGSYGKSYGKRYGLSRYSRYSYKRYSSYDNGKYGYGGYSYDNYSYNYAYRYSYGDKPSRNTVYTESVHKKNTESVSQENEQKE